MATATSTVTYRDLEPQGFPGYRVGDDGTVWSCLKRDYLTNRGRVRVRYVVGDEWQRMATPHAPGRYPKVSLRSPNGRRTVHVCHLVLLAFVGPRPPGMECCHNDGDKENSRLGNLRWDTRKANAADFVRHGRSAKGERNPRGKLKAADIPLIRQAAAGGETRKSIAARFGVAPESINAILRGQTWKHLPTTTA